MQAEPCSCRHKAQLTRPARSCSVSSYLSMASGEAEPLQYKTTVLRVSIHCEGCKKKVKKVLHSLEGVYKVTVDAAQHKVTVTGSVGADALIRRLHKSGKQAALWPVPAAAEGKKPEEVAAAAPAAAALSAGECGKGADKADAKPKEAAKEAESESSEKKPDKDKGSDKKPEKAEAKKPKEEAQKESEVAEKKKGSPELAKEAIAEEAGGEETGGKKGKKKKNKQKDAGEVDAAAEKPPQPQPHRAMTVPAPVLGPDRPHGGFPFYAPQPVMSYNVAHPSPSVLYYAPTPVLSMQPMPPPPPQILYGLSPYPPMMPPPPEFLYGPPGMRSSPPQESYNNMFNEENPNSCSLM